MTNDTKTLQTLAHRIRRDAIVQTSAASSGHPTSSLSCAELLSTLFFHTLRIDSEHPHGDTSDRFVLSKGHGAPALWAVLAEAGLVDAEELEQLRRFESDLEGHPTPRNEWVEVATGSLGQGLSAGVGMAIAARKAERPTRTFVLLGDGELAEGSVWEAAEMASFLELDGLKALVDVNAFGQTGQTRYGHDLDVYQRRFEAFGWWVEQVDGHDIDSLTAALDRQAAVTDRPAILLARTVKGKGVPDLEGAEGKHGKPVPSEEAALAALPNLDLDATPRVHRPETPGHNIKRDVFFGGVLSDPPYEIGQEVPTRKAYGEALKRLGQQFPALTVLDGEVSNSTKTEIFKEAFPERYVEGFIAEQNMVGMALGLSTQGHLPFVSSFASFLSRAHDQIRMSALSRANIKFAGSHAGVSIGEDGPSQMGLEDMAMFRSLPGSAVFYPADAVATDKLVQEAARTRGQIYLRLTRGATPVIYEPSTDFVIGGSHTLREHEDDCVTLVSAGITLFEALKTADALREEGIHCRVIDLYSVKPLDVPTLRRAAEETDCIICIEDHYPEGGLGEAVASEIAGFDCIFQHLAVQGAPRSGSPERLMREFQIDAEAIEHCARNHAPIMA